MPVPKINTAITKAMRMRDTSHPSFSLSQPDTPKIICSGFKMNPKAIDLSSKKKNAIGCLVEGADWRNAFVQYLAKQ